jgi:uncharacterized Zn-finger protein
MFTAGRRIEDASRACYLRPMDQSATAANSLPPPEVFKVTTLQVACDGSGEVSPALGHPRVFLRIEPDLGFVECGYCDRRFVLEGGPADQLA